MSKFIQTSGSPKRIKKRVSISRCRYLTELRPYVAVLDFGKTNIIIHTS